MSVKLLTEHDLEFLSLKGSCTGSSESTLVKMPHCWKSHTTAQLNMVRVCHNYSSHTNLRHQDKVMSQYIFATKYFLAHLSRGNNLRHSVGVVNT